MGPAPEACSLEEYERLLAWLLWPAPLGWPTLAGCALPVFTPDTSLMVAPPPEPPCEVLGGVWCYIPLHVTKSLPASHCHHPRR